MNQVSLGQELKSNSYPGRGIVVGYPGDGTKAITAYFITGRSTNSRNHVFMVDREGIRTQVFDPTKLEDPSLIIYIPVRVLGDKTIVASGDQTDTIYGGMDHQMISEQSLRYREFEPDAPNYVPQISGILHIENSNYNYAISILKSGNTNPDSCLRLTYAYQSPVAEEERFTRAYIRDGSPLPNLKGEPKKMGISGDVDVSTNLVWNSLNEGNKVSLFVRYIDIVAGTYETGIVSRNE